MDGQPTSDSSSGPKKVTSETSLALGKEPYDKAANATRTPRHFPRLLLGRPGLTANRKKEALKPSSAADEDEPFTLATVLMNSILGLGPSPSPSSGRAKSRANDAVAVDFFLHAWSPAWTTLLVTMSGSLNSPNPFLATFYPTALQNEELFHSIVALSFCALESQASLEAHSETMKSPSANVFYHRMWALKFLRQKLTPPIHHVDDAVLLTTMMLIAIDGILEDKNSFNAHCRGLRELIRVRGGLHGSGLDYLLRRFITQNDYDWALENGHEVARALPKDRPPISFAIIPSGYRKLTLSAQSRAKLLNIIGRMAYWVESVGRVWSGAALDVHRELLLTYAPFEETFEILDCLKSASAFNEQSLESCLCLALILISSNFYGDAKGRFFTWYRTIRMQLTTRLQSRFKGSADNSAQRDCWVWIAMVAVESWRSGYFLPLPGRELMYGVLVRYEETNDWSALEPILKRFLWYDPLGAKMEACWRDCTMPAGEMKTADVVLLDCVRPTSDLPEPSRGSSLAREETEPS